MGCSEVRLNRNRLFITGNGRVHLLQFLKRVAAVVIGLGEIGPNRDGVVVTGDRRVELPEFKKRGAQI